MSTYRVMIGATGQFLVEAETDVEAERAVKSAIEKGALRLGGCPLMGAMATASVIREILVMPEAKPRSPVRPNHHVLEAQSLTLGQRLDIIGLDRKKAH